MAEGQSERLREYKAELDQMLASVMPDSWEGHGRLKIAESDLSSRERRYAMKLLDKITSKHPETDAEFLATKVIEKMRE